MGHQSLEQRVSGNLSLAPHSHVPTGLSECLCGKRVWGPRGQSQDSQGKRTVAPSGEDLSSPSCLCV